MQCSKVRTLAITVSAWAKQRRSMRTTLLSANRNETLNVRNWNLGQSSLKIHRSDFKANYSTNHV